MLDSTIASATFLWPVRVYYEDTDLAGLVYYANYLRFMERARTEWLRAFGFEQTELREQWGIVFAVRSVTLDYLRPAVFNDELTVTVESVTARGSRIRLAQRVLRAADVLTVGRIEVACLDMRSLRPARIPQSVLQKIGSHA
ncbi:MAG TPA: tol-pal system-associated acyl-CoA thioesterase [Burkholderiales bacterium]|jgi:acyl-CoA thioester hydrolase|nr:tol-pal system-associated acyl-CoA thioesterase [Burkholderiales bacterium]